MAALVLVGCAENAILELDVALPSAADACGATQVAVEARIPPEGSCFFDQDWFDGDTAVLTLAEAPSTEEVSVVADGEDVTRPLCVRIRPCATEECPPPDLAIGARAEITIERAFYVGQYTRIELDPIDLCASTASTVDRCAVEGCAGGAPHDDYCTPEGRHLCE